MFWLSKSVFQLDIEQLPFLNTGNPDNGYKKEGTVITVASKGNFVRKDRAFGGVFTNLLRIM
jgi:hypothetical protein